MSKFSVKKPLTVFVGVVIIFVLGIVSYTRMVPDLLPSMDFPYVVLITTYPGASPEKVETVVSKPLEQSMATLEHIKSINSTSSENYSTIILEFDSDVNMDSTTVDIIQKVDQLQEYWDSGVSSPRILKLNPSMLPVLVAAAEMEGMDTFDFSSFVDNVLLNKLEGISGVASISSSGLVSREVHVNLKQEKIDVVNAKIISAIDDGFNEAIDELNNLVSEAEKGKNELQKSKKQLESGANLINEGQAEINEKSSMVDAGLAEINKQIGILTQTLNELKLSRTTLAALIESHASLQKEIAQRTEQITQLDAIIAKVDNGDITDNSHISDEEKAFLESVNIYVDSFDLNDPTDLATFSGLLNLRKIEYTGLKTASEAAVNTINNTLASMQLDINTAPAALAQMTQAISDIEAGLEQLETENAKLEDGRAALNEAELMLSMQLVEGIVAMSEGAALISLGEAQLESGMAELEKGFEKIEEERSNAYDAADLSNIITMSMISNILSAQNFSMPAGYAENNGESWLVSVGEEFAEIDDLDNLLLFDMGIDGLDPIYLNDVANIQLVDNSDIVYANINGNPGVLMQFSKQSNYSTAEVSNNIADKFEQLSLEYPGLKFSSLVDQGDYIYMVVDSIINNLLLGALFAILILFIFLKDIRPTFITLCSIPLSVVFAITLMYFSGVTINMISLSGLAVAVGMLVDNSVVVIENIYRLMALGYSPARAAISGAKQVSGAIMASTLTTISMFLPIVFVEGITRQLFEDLALTLAFSLLASLIVALTLVPAMASKMSAKTKQRPDLVLNRIAKHYRRLLNFCLRHKAPVLILSVVMLGASVALELNRGFSFMPDMEMNQLTLEMEMPEEATVEQIKYNADIVVERIGQIEEIETVGAMLDSSDNSITMYVLVSEDSKRSVKEIRQEINGMFEDIPADINAEAASAMGGAASMLTGSGITVNIYTNENQDTIATARHFAEIMGNVEGVSEVDDGIGETEPELRILVDKNAAMKEGLTTAQVFMEISSALVGETTSTKINYDGKDIDVKIIEGEESEFNTKYIKELIINVTAKDGSEKQVALKDIASFEDSETTASITRQNQRRYTAINASVAEGYNVSLVAQEIEKALAADSITQSIDYQFEGENEIIMESFSQLALMLLLGIVFVYLIMVAQFQSLKSPFIIMFTIPLAFTGGFLALLIAGMELSVIALIGLVMLCGIIVNNGIVLVDYINQLRIEGMARHEAIEQACSTRLRPILMTTLTTILALTTAAMGLGSGGALMQPVAVVCIGGLSYATLLTLLVIPVIYDIFNKKEIKTLNKEDMELINE